jgi:hypothetical protein
MAHMQSDLTGGDIVFGGSQRMRKIFIRDFMSFIGLCLSIAGLCVLGYQCLLWMKHGPRPPLTLQIVLEVMGLRELAAEGSGIGIISAWMSNLPLSGFLITAGLAVITCGLALTAGGFSPDAAKHESAEPFQANFGRKLSS